MPDVSSCRKISTVQLCNLEKQPSGCGLVIGNRHGCHRTVYNSTDENFTLVRPIARSLVIATRAKSMFLTSEYEADDWEAIEIKSPTFAVDIPRGKRLMVGSMKVRSRVDQESCDGKLRIIVPETQYSPVESLYNEWMGTWTNGLNIAVIWFSVFYPAAPEDGVRFCVVCGKHDKFRLDRHLSETHRVPKRSELYEAYQQVGRGIVDRMTKASVDLEKVPSPHQPGEWLIYNAFVQRLRECGIPILNDHLVQQPPAQQRPPLRRPQHRRAREVGDRRARELEEAAAIVEEVEEAVPAVLEEVVAAVVEGEQQHIREAGEGRAMEEDHRPATRQGPSIPREQLCLTVTVAEDRLYRGGPKPHPAFLEAPYKTLMFAHEMDVWREEEDYYVQTFTIPPQSQRSLSEWN
ncbi:hypothetical protein COOONC_15352 [Cooperia oncophora]